MTLPFFAFVIFLAFKLLVQLFLTRSMVWVVSEACSSPDPTVPCASFPNYALMKGRPRVARGGS
jgi:hypothetical protein